MVTALSKLLLLVALLGSFVNAASNRDGASRGLSFLHPHVSDSHSHDEAESGEESVDYYYSKSGKSGGKSGGKGLKSDKKKSDKESGKGMKSDRNEKPLHAADGDEVMYEVVVGHHRSSKSNKAKPDFEMVEIGYKSAKAGKTSYYNSEGKYAKDAKSGSKTPSKLVIIATRLPILLNAYSYFYDLLFLSLMQKHPLSRRPRPWHRSQPFLLVRQR